MAVLNTTTVQGIYNILFPDGVEEMVMGFSPMLGMLKKEISVFDGLGGRGKELCWEVGEGTGASGSYSVAYAQPGAETFKRPFVTRGHLYAVRQIDHESWRASKGNNYAQRDLVKQAVLGATRELKLRASSILQGGLGGSIGCIATGSNTGTATITLSDRAQAVNFKPNQRLQAFTTVAGGVIDSGNVVTLTATGVNHEAGTLTATGNWTAGISGVAVGDYLIPEGDFGTTPVTADAWNPETLIAVGAGDSFFGIDRGGSIRMQGMRYTATAGTIDESIIQAAAWHAQMGGSDDTAFINPVDYALMNLQQYQVITRNAIGSNGKEIAKVGFNGFKLHGPNGDINVFPDPFRKRGRVRLTRLDSWKIWSLGEMFGRMTEGMGGDGMLRIAGADASYMVFGGHWQLVNECPMDSCIITLQNAPT